MLLIISMLMRAPINVSWRNVKIVVKNITLIGCMLFSSALMAAEKQSPKLSDRIKIRLHDRAERKKIAAEKAEEAAERMRRRLYRERLWISTFKDMGKSWRKTSAIKWAIIGFSVGAVYVFCTTHKCFPVREKEDD